MREVLADIDGWWETGDAPVALATVVQTWGSAPRKAGAKMAMMADGAISGSVSGGCVEGAVYEEGMTAVETGQPKLLHFGVADETAWEVGLACGGIIEVFVEPLDRAAYAFARSLLIQDRAGDMITIIRGPANKLGKKLVVARSGEKVGTLGDAALDAQAAAAASQLRLPGRVQLTDEIELFVDAYRPAKTLVMVGGVHIAQALTNMAKLLGYNTVVVDPRRAFGSEARFPHVDTLIQAWPKKAFAAIEVGQETAVALLTHDPKIDDPALEAILGSNAFYIGALGSKKTHAKRVARLQEKGFTEAQISKIHAPIGLSIGAQNPEEIALSIMAEIVQAQRVG